MTVLVEMFNLLAKYYIFYFLDSLMLSLTLSTCNLVFRDHREKADYNDTSSRGNFLSIVELLGTYDLILQELLSKSKGQIKYLSPKIQNEFISVLVLKIENALINEINVAILLYHIRYK